MVRWSPSSSPRSGGPGWLSFAAGLAAGLAGGLLLARRPEEVLPRPRLARAWQGASRRLEAVAESLRDTPAMDLDAIRAALDGEPGAGGLRVRALTDGILEVVGSAPDVDTARRLLEILTAQPGVERVVNRVWTPSSASPTDD